MMIVRELRAYGLSQDSDFSFSYVPQPLTWTTDSVDVEKSHVLFEFKSERSKQYATLLMLKYHAENTQT